MKRKYFYIFLVIVLLMTFFAPACTPKETPTEKELTLSKNELTQGEKEPIKVGFLTDLTGILSINGIAGRQGATLALEEIDYQINGRELQIIIEDDSSDPAIAIERARKLVETDQIDILFGPFNVACLNPVAEYINRNVKIPHIYIYTVFEGDILNAEWGWAPYGSMNQHTYTTGVYAIEQLGYKTATIMGIDYLAGRNYVGGFWAAFEERGGKVIQDQWIPLGTSDVASYIINLEKADVLAPWFAGVTMNVGFQQIKEFGVEMPVVAPQAGFIGNPQQLEQIGDFGTDVITSDLYSWKIDTPANKEFVEAYQKRWGEPPAVPAYAAYTSLQIVFEALRKTGGDATAEVLAKALDETKYESVIGLIEFGEGRVGSFDYYVVKAIKVENKFEPEILAKYRIDAKKVGNELKYSVNSSEIFK